MALQNQTGATQMRAGVDGKCGAKDKVDELSNILSL